MDAYFSAWVVDFGDYKVTPWTVEGSVDYERLVKEFGVSRITGDLRAKLKRLAGDLHPFISREFYYAHRDLDLVLEDIEGGKGFFLYTGIAPSRGPMHLGHLPSFLLTQWFQERFGVNAYIMIPDEEKYLAKKVDSLRDVDERVREVERIIASLGFDPDRTFLFRDREYIYHLYDAAVTVARRINYSVAKAVFGFTGETSIGLIFYPALQIVPTLFEKKRPLIPCAIDQDPYWRIQRDIAESLGYYKTATILSKFVPPLLGEGKMSASDPRSAIYLTDDEQTIRRKISAALTGGAPTAAEQRKHGGNPDVCIVYRWHALFQPEDESVADIYKKCREGKLICGDCKKMLADLIVDFVQGLRERAEKADKVLEKIKYSGKLARRMWEWEFEVP